jgi:hypothetical protein
MPHVVLEREGLKLEADLSLSDIRELMGLKTSNGHMAAAPKESQIVSAPGSVTAAPQDGFGLFLKEISDRGRKFIHALRENPDGIEASVLATKVGFSNAVQIGGLTGGGLAKVGNRLGVPMSKIYRKEITTPNGVRTVMFYPGKLIKNEKPAV